MDASFYINHLKPNMSALYSLYLKDRHSFLGVLLANGASKAPATNTLYEWSDLQLAPQAWAATAGVSAATLNGGNATITVTATAGLIQGMVIKVTEGGIRKAYQLIVKSVTDSTNFVVDVYGSTAATIMASTAKFEIVSTPIQENNKNFNVQASKLPVRVGNYTQIFESSFEISDTALNSQTFTDVNSISFSLRQSFIDIERQMGRQAWYGKKVQRNGAMKGSFGGIAEYITTVSNVSGALTQAMIADLIATVVKAGGQTDTIACNIDVARKISKMNVAGNNPIITQDSKQVGSYVMSFMSDIPVAGGLVNNIVIDDSLDSSELYVLSKNDIALVPYANRGITAVDGSVNGQDGATGIVRGEYTLEVRGGDFTHGRLAGFDA